jgi:hypothetical protein
VSENNCRGDLSRGAELATLGMKIRLRLPVSARSIHPSLFLPAPRKILDRGIDRSQRCNYHGTHRRAGASGGLFRLRATSGGAFPARAGIRTTNKGLLNCARLFAGDDRCAVLQLAVREYSRNSCNNCWRSLSRMTHCAWVMKNKNRDKGMKEGNGEPSARLPGTR